MLTADSHTDSAFESPRQRTGAYVLMTAAYNEELNIGRTIQSVLAQTLLPKRWVIVSDGSSDRTDEIVTGCAEKHDFIAFLRISRPPGRSFGSKVAALHAGYKLLDGVAFDFIGNLDADVSVGPDYFESLTRNLQNSPTLGIAGGFVCEEKEGEFRNRRANRVYSVAHAAQLVRRECYETIEGYAVLEYGGEDWHAQTSARMNGWEAEAFPDLKIFHHRPTGQAGNLLRHKFRQGRMDYAFGSYPPFEIIKCIERFPEKPIVAGGVVRLCGFFWSWASREKRPVSDRFVSFLRSEQKQKLLSLLPGSRRRRGLKSIR
jgi:biofilm PGA synthesis N-glycosyltransferase PgaC